MKQCNVCKEFKPLSDFHKNKSRPDGLRYSCKNCTNKRNRKWLDKKRKSMSCDEYSKMRKSNWCKSNYGITLEEFNELLDFQGGVCAICLQPETRKEKGKIKSLCIDHNHKLPKGHPEYVRGLLCFNCNTAIGSLKDNPELMRRSADYVEAS